MDNAPPPVSVAPPNRFAPGLLLGMAISIALFSVIGIIGGVVAFSSVQQAKNDVRKGWNLVPVVVAAVDIPENTLVAMEMISQRSIPEQFVTTSVVKPDSVSYIVNQKILVAVQAGDPILWSQFETTRAAAHISTSVSPKELLVSIKASGEAGVGGWIRPDDRVDVIAVFPAPETKELTAMTLLQSVRVVATGRMTHTTNINLLPEAERQYNEVTVALAPEDAEKLALMNQLGTVSLALRNDVAPKREKTTKITAKNLGP